MDFGTAVGLGAGLPLLRAAEKPAVVVIAPAAHVKQEVRRDNDGLLWSPRERSEKAGDGNV